MLPGLRDTCQFASINKTVISRATKHRLRLQPLKYVTVQLHSHTHTPVFQRAVVLLQLPVPLRRVVPLDFFRADEVLHDLRRLGVRVLHFALRAEVHPVLLPHAGRVVVRHPAAHLIHACEESEEEVEDLDT